MEHPLFDQAPNPRSCGVIRTANGSWKEPTRPGKGKDLSADEIAEIAYQGVWVPLIKEARENREGSVDIELGDMSTLAGQSYHHASVKLAKSRGMIFEVASIPAHETQTRSRHVLRIHLEY